MTHHALRRVGGVASSNAFYIPEDACTCASGSHRPEDTLTKCGMHTVAVTLVPPYYQRTENGQIHTPRFYPEVFTCIHVSKIRGRNTVLPNFLPDCLRVVLLLPVLLGYQRKVVYTLVWLVG